MKPLHRISKESWHQIQHKSLRYCDPQLINPIRKPRKPPNPYYINHLISPASSNITRCNSCSALGHKKRRRELMASMVKALRSKSSTMTTRLASPRSVHWKNIEMESLEIHWNSGAINVFNYVHVIYQYNMYSVYRILYGSKLWISLEWYLWNSNEVCEFMVFVMLQEADVVDLLGMVSIPWLKLDGLPKLPST